MSSKKAYYLTLEMDKTGLFDAKIDLKVIYERCSVRPRDAGKWVFACVLFGNYLLLK